jgi:hypothetical protein
MAFQFARVRDWRIATYKHPNSLSFFQYDIECDNGDVFSFGDAEMDQYLVPFEGDYETMSILFGKGKRVL